MLNFLYLLTTTTTEYSDVDDLCADLAPALRIVGIVYKGIQIIVPIILIVVGMLDFAKAVTEKNEDKIKEAQKKLISKAIAAVCVFLVTVIVGVLMRVVGNQDYKDCMDCITSPFKGKCPEWVQKANNEFNG